jgi:hypothetical protein
VPQTKTLKERRVADKMTFYILYQGIDEVGFEKIIGTTSTKEAWGIFLIAYKGTNQIK